MNYSIAIELPEASFLGSSFGTLIVMTWKLVESVLAKQLFVEASRQDKPFETAEDILMHLLDGGFTSASYYRLQTANTYLANLRPSAFALSELIGGNHPGKSHLRDEISERFQILTHFSIRPVSSSF